MTQTSGDGKPVSRLMQQLERLLAEGCCPEGDMVVFPVPDNSGSLAKLAQTPGVQIERVGPDVVRIRRPV